MLPSLLSTGLPPTGLSMVEKQPCEKTEQERQEGVTASSTLFQHRECSGPDKMPWIGMRTPSLAHSGKIARYLTRLQAISGTAPHRQRSAETSPSILGVGFAITSTSPALPKPANETTAGRERHIQLDRLRHPPQDSLQSKPGRKKDADSRHSGDTHQSLLSQRHRPTRPTCW